MPSLLAMIVSAVAGWAVHAAIGDYVSTMTDFVVSTIVSGVVYVAAYVWFKRLRDGG